MFPSSFFFFKLISNNVSLLYDNSSNAKKFYHKYFLFILRGERILLTFSFFIGNIRCIYMEKEKSTPEYTGCIQWVQQGKAT